MFHYRHKDGREGSGESAWRAIVHAVGTDLHGTEFEDPKWEVNERPGVAREAALIEKGTGRNLGCLSELVN